MGATVNPKIYYIVILIIVRLKKKAKMKIKKCDNDVALVLFLIYRFTGFPFHLMMYWKLQSSLCLYFHFFVNFRYHYFSSLLNLNNFFDRSDSVHRIDELGKTCHRCNANLTQLTYTCDTHCLFQVNFITSDCKTSLSFTVISDL